jgi:hypothetical protein
LPAFYLIVCQQHFLDRLCVVACILNPINDGVFLVPFDACRATDATSFCDEGQGFNDLILRSTSTIEDRSFGFYESAIASLALETLSAGFRLAELDDVRLVFALPFTIVSAVCIWTEIAHLS